MDLVGPQGPGQSRSLDTKTYEYELPLSAVGSGHLPDPMYKLKELDQQFAFTLTLGISEIYDAYYWQLVSHKEINEHYLDDMKLIVNNFQIHV